jgi:uncharacterized protein YceK
MQLLGFDSLRPHGRCPNFFLAVQSILSELPREEIKARGGRGARCTAIINKMESRWFDAVVGVRLPASALFDHLFFFLTVQFDLTYHPKE